jgi:hypothetical protein
MASAPPAEACPVAGLIAMLLRGSFRLVLGLAVGISSAYAVLWFLEAAQKSGAIGSSTRWLNWS